MLSLGVSLPSPSLPPHPPSNPGCLPPASLPPTGDGPVQRWLALLWYSLSPLFCVLPAVRVKKSLNLRHCQAHSQNKGLSRASQLRTGPLPPETGRRGQPGPERGNRSPREASSTKLQSGFVANQDFLGFWMPDIHQKGHSQRAAPQRGTWHT